MCKTEGIYWIIFKYEGILTKKALKQLAKAGMHKNSLIQYYTNEERKEQIINAIHKSGTHGCYFQITDKQFGLIQNFYGHQKIKYTCPLDHTYVYVFNNGVSFIPITRKQLDEMVYL